MRQREMRPASAAIGGTAPSATRIVMGSLEMLEGLRRARRLLRWAAREGSLGCRYARM